MLTLRESCIVICVGSWWYMRSLDITRYIIRKKHYDMNMNGNGESVKHYDVWYLRNKCGLKLIKTKQSD